MRPAEVVFISTSGPRQPPAEKAMDLANNRQGQIAMKKIGTKAGDAKILESFEKDLAEGNLIVIKPLPANRRK